MSVKRSCSKFTYPGNQRESVATGKRKKRSRRELGLGRFWGFVMLSLVTRIVMARLTEPAGRSIAARFSLMGFTTAPFGRQRRPGATIKFPGPSIDRLGRFYPPGTRTARFLSTPAPDSSLLEGLNDAQVRAVTQPLASITRVVAGPGAGKTRVLTSRIAYLLHHDPHQSVLAVTFTKKAAGDMQHRLERLFDTTPEEPQTIGGNIVMGTSTTSSSSLLNRVTLGTFHSVCAKILRWNGRLLDTLPSIVRDTVGSTNTTRMDGNFAIVDQSEQLRILRECEKELKIKMDEIKPMTILTALGKIKAKLATGEDPMRPPDKSPPSRAVREAMKYFPLYRHKILSQNALDFDDLILLTRELLSAHEDVRENLRRRWHHVLVDEFQDTSRVQLDLVKLLSDSSLLVVGDADQSIYSWRGAHVESMSDFCHEFDHRLNGVETVYLMENYRSTTNIVSAAQKIISADTTTSTQDSLRKDMKPMRGAGPKPRVLACLDGKAEASFVVQTVQEMISSGEYTAENSVAVIYRTNAQSRDLEEACVKAKLPYVLRGASGSFYKRAEIKDCLCFLRLLSNGRDDASLARAIKTPSRGIGDVALNEFRQFCAQVEAFHKENLPDQRVPTPLDVLVSLSDIETFPAGAPSPVDSMSKRALNRFVPFGLQMQKLRQVAYTKHVADLLSEMVEILGLKEHFDSISKSKAEFTDRWSNVVELMRAAERYSGDGASLKRADNMTDDVGDLVETPLGNFLDDVALVTDMADEALDSEKAENRLVVSLMTIHASKGMEFDAVFLVGVEDGTLPTKQAIMEGEGSVPLDEEKRLCYVAMTRAKTNLFMTWRREVAMFNGNSFTSIDAKRSRFLDILVTKKSKSKDAGAAKSKDKTSKQQQRSAGSTTLPASNLVANRVKRPTARSASPGAPKLHGARRGLASTGVSRPPSRKSTQKHRAELRTAATSRRKWSNARRPAPVENLKSSNTNGSQSPQRSDPAFANGSSGKQRSSETMDSTWFYPVGCSVVHKQLGPGQVLPPPFGKDGEMLVRVQFPNGDEHDFPADGMDLHLDLSS